MQFFGQLKKALLELLGADPAQGDQGRTWFNTVSGRPKIDDGTVIDEIQLKQHLVANIIDEAPATAGKDQQCLELNGALNDFVWGNGVISDTKAGIDARPRVAKLIYYATDLKKYFGDDGTNLTDLGGGVGSPSIFQVFDAEDNSVVGFTNFTIDAATELAGDASYTVTVGTPARTPNVPIDVRRQDQECSCRFVSRLTSGEYTANIKDNAANILGTVDVGAGKQKVSIEFFVKASVTDVYLEIVDKTSATGITLDDIVFDDNPYQYKNLMERQEWFAHTGSGGGFGSGNTFVPVFTTVAVDENPDSLVTITNDAVNGFTITANKKTTVSAVFSTRNSSGTEHFGWVKNGAYSTDFLAQAAGDIISSEFANNAEGGSTTFTGTLEAGDIIAPVVTNKRGPGSTSKHWTGQVSAEAEAEHVVTPAKSTLSDWIAFTPTLSAGFGTVTNSRGFYRQVGDSMEIEASLTTGTVTATVLTFGIPGGVTIDTAKIESSGTRNDLGVYNRLNGTGLVYDGGRAGNLFSDGSDTGSLFFNANPINSTQMDKESGTSSIVSGDSVILRATVPIAEWSSLGTFLAAVPVQRVAVISDQQTGTDGGTFTLGAWQTRTLNTIEGDDTFVTLSGNRFTLPAGRYVFDGDAPAYQVSSHQTRVVDDPAGSPTTVIIGTVQFTNTSVVTRSMFSSVVEINSPQTFEVQHRCSATKTVNGFGVGAAFGEDIVYTKIKITKLR